MIILSHRGDWHSPAEQNTEVAFERALAHGFGIETDIRDHNGDLVISHDIPRSSCLSVTRLFDLYRSLGSNLPLALNIKADGLALPLKALLTASGITNYFVFDMSIPDHLHYLRHDLKTFARHSEIELPQTLHEESVGIWLDEFHGHWISDEVILHHRQNQKRICLVSPELHRRSYIKEWEHYKRLNREMRRDDLMICTDHPHAAQEFFV